MHQTQFLLKGHKEEGWILKLEVSFMYPSKSYSFHIPVFWINALLFKFKNHFLLTSESFHNFTSDYDFKALLL